MLLHGFEIVEHTQGFSAERNSAGFHSWLCAYGGQPYTGAQALLLPPPQSAFALLGFFLRPTCYLDELGSNARRRDLMLAASVRGSVLIIVWLVPLVGAGLRRRRA